MLLYVLLGVGVIIITSVTVGFFIGAVVPQKCGAAMLAILVLLTAFTMNGFLEHTEQKLAWLLLLVARSNHGMTSFETDDLMFWRCMRVVMLVVARVYSDV